jgi:hypothetical protein
MSCGDHCWFKRRSAWDESRVIKDNNNNNNNNNNNILTE